MRTEQHLTTLETGDAGACATVKQRRRHATPSGRSVAVDVPHDRSRTTGRSTVDHHVEQLAKRLQGRSPARYERWAKPVIDRLLAAVLILVLSPVLLIVCMAVLLVIGQPVVLGQTRAGRSGRAFAMLKFRTMLPDRRDTRSGYAGPERRRTHKSPDDPRHTPLGRLMRKLSLDELPQLFNVLRGEMSLVGPRPELIDLTTAFAPWQHGRHLVKPGVTGLWQVTERGKGLRLHECVELDLEYIDGLSFWRDVAILLRTPIALLRTRGVF